MEGFNEQQKAFNDLNNFAQGILSELYAQFEQDSAERSKLAEDLWQARREADEWKATAEQFRQERDRLTYELNTLRERVKNAQRCLAEVI